MLCIYCVCYTTRYINEPTVPLHLQNSRQRQELQGQGKLTTPHGTIQEKLGADLIVAFDDHESPLWDYETTKLSLERTSRWAVASRKAQKRKDQLMYGVVHG
ncbi:MAG: hypothetical protein AAB553_01070 [Patescibacteria group bacterium]